MPVCVSVAGLYVREWQNVHDELLREFATYYRGEVLTDLKQDTAQLFMIDIGLCQIPSILDTVFPPSSCILNHPTCKAFPIPTYQEPTSNVTTNQSNEDNLPRIYGGYLRKETTGEPEHRGNFKQTYLHVIYLAVTRMYRANCRASRC